jgi:Trk-type K+ transport system membrane component
MSEAYQSFDLREFSLHPELLNLVTVVLKICWWILAKGYLHLSNISGYQHPRSK